MEMTDGSSTPDGHGRRTAVLAMQPGLSGALFDAQTWSQLSRLLHVDPGLVLHEFQSGQAIAALAGAEILITGWGCPPITESVLAAAPRLAAVVHTGGSVKAHVTEACWERGIVVSTAAAANALPVAEYTLAAILFAAKGARALEHRYRSRRDKVDLIAEYPTVGTYRRTVGIVGASRIGRRVIELLRPFDFVVSLYDPFVTEAEAQQLGVTLATLPEVLSGNDIVTLHAPSLPSTQHMIDGPGLARMRTGATLINTARGALVDQQALERELASGRINAVIDVTEPEVLPADSPLFTLPNVMLTPHIAGAWGNEIRRLGVSAFDEVRRYLAGLPFAYAVTPDQLAYIA
jgi:phosphoglycerate dehydrogenase-like enzyme